jgi:hypothetical protein
MFVKNMDSLFRATVASFLDKFEPETLISQLPSLEEENISELITMSKQNLTWVSVAKKSEIWIRLGTRIGSIGSLGTSGGRGRLAR